MLLKKTDTTLYICVYVNKLTVSQFNVVQRTKTTNTENREINNKYQYAQKKNDSDKSLWNESWMNPVPLA